MGDILSDGRAVFSPWRCVARLRTACGCCVRSGLALGPVLLVFVFMSEAKVRGDFLRALEELDGTVGRDLPKKLREMVRLRCSHINGCSYSVRLHSDSLGAHGARVDLISALARPVKLMRDDLVTPPEAAALRLAEILTDYPRGLEIEARDEAGKYFNAKQLGSLVEVVAVINAWNRVTRGSE